MKPVVILTQQVNAKSLTDCSNALDFFIAEVGTDSLEIVQIVNKEVFIECWAVKKIVEVFQTDTSIPMKFYHDQQEMAKRKPPRCNAEDATEEEVNYSSIIHQTEDIFKMRTTSSRKSSYKPKTINPPVLSLTEMWLTAHGETMSIAKTARVLGISRCTVYRHKAAGHFMSAGGSRLLTRSVGAYIEAQGATDKRGVQGHGRIS